MRYVFLVCVKVFVLFFLVIFHFVNIICREDRNHYNGAGSNNINAHYNSTSDHDDHDVENLSLQDAYVLDPIMTLTFTLENFAIDTTLLKKLECGDYIDVRGPKLKSVGRKFWYLAKIIDISNRNINKIKCITVQYQGWDDKCIETIELISSIFCTCKFGCTNNKHRIASVSSQSGFDNIPQFPIDCNLNNYKFSKTYDITNLNNCTLIIFDLNTDISINDLYQLIANILNIKDKNQINYNIQISDIYGTCHDLNASFDTIGQIRIDKTMIHRIVSVNRVCTSDNDQLVKFTTNTQYKNDTKNAFLRYKTEIKRQLSLKWYDNPQIDRGDRKYQWLPQDIMSKYDLDKVFKMKEWEMKQSLFGNEFNKLPLTMTIKSLYIPNDIIRLIYEFIVDSCGSQESESQLTTGAYRLMIMTSRETKNFGLLNRVPVMNYFDCHGNKCMIG